VVQRDDGDGRVEGPGLAIQVEQRDGANFGRLASRIDRQHVKSQPSQDGRELTGAGPDLEHARGRRRQG
jgi:hypothetical protein